MTPTPVAEPPVTMMFRMHLGEVVALMPDLEGAPGYCTCYVHNGQHGSADYKRVVWNSRPATPEEYAPLLAELTSAPYHYNARVRRRWMRRR